MGSAYDYLAKHELALQAFSGAQDLYEELGNHRLRLPR